MLTILALLALLFGSSHAPAPHSTGGDVHAQTCVVQQDTGDIICN